MRIHSLSTVFRHQHEFPRRVEFAYRDFDYRGTAMRHPLAKAVAKLFRRCRIEALRTERLSEFREVGIGELRRDVALLVMIALKVAGVPEVAVGEYDVRERDLVQHSG